MLEAAVEIPSEYITYTQNTHGREEELQWARILATGNPVKGMVVIFLQKMCAAYHEFEPAFRAGAVAEDSLAHYRQRLANRVNVVLTVLRDHGLDNLEGAAELERLRQATLTAQNLAELADLAEPIHLVNHTITDALEGH
jgi:hypothetical protein